MTLAVKKGKCSDCAFCSKFTRVKNDKRYVCGNFQCSGNTKGPFEHPEAHGCTNHFMQKEARS